MLNKEKIHRMLKSNSKEDILLAYNILRGTESSDVLAFFENYHESDFSEDLNTFGVSFSDFARELLREDEEEDILDNHYYLKGEYWLAMTRNEVCLDTTEVAQRCINNELSRGFKNI